MTYLDIIIRVAGTALCAFLLIIAAGAFYEVFLRRRPKIELNRDRRRRMHWLIEELRKEIEKEEEA